MKNKNPLYVVKGNNVQEAKNFVDLILKKFNLEPAVEILTNIFKMLLAQITSYPMLVAVKNMLDQLMIKVFGLVSTMKMKNA
ncbi:MAG: hypothetical protein ACJ76H_01040 [Bacteriovoracaceae bacterium]